MPKLLLNCDGGSRGNPGPAAYGFVVQDITSGAGIVLEKCGNYLGITTNNQAEYAGLIAGLTWITKHHPLADVRIVLDSLLVVNQVKGIFRVKSPGLIPQLAKVRGLLAKLPHYTIEHTLRHGNSQADELVNSALDQRSSV